MKALKLSDKVTFRFPDGETLHYHVAEGTSEYYFLFEEDSNPNDIIFSKIFNDFLGDNGYNRDKQDDFCEGIVGKENILRGYCFPEVKGLDSLTILVVALGRYVDISVNGENVSIEKMYPTTKSFSTTKSHTRVRIDLI